MRSLLFLLACAAVTAVTGDVAANAPAGARVLRVCADPNNMPFSNARGEGFENRVAEILAEDLGARVETTWWAQRRGFFRNTLDAGRCDVVVGVPVRFDRARTTRPFYRSVYVFASRADRHLRVESLDDPRLRTMRIGVPLAGDDGVNPPPERALARRGIVDGVVGYTLYGDYSRQTPAAELLDAAVRGDVDVAIVWGPLAGWYAKEHPGELSIAPIRPEADEDGTPFAFSLGVGVRRRDAALGQELDAALGRHAAEIDALLDEYGVPRP